MKTHLATLTLVLGAVAAALATAQRGDQLTLQGETHRVHGMDLPKHVVFKQLEWDETNKASLATSSANWGGWTLTLSVRKSKLYIDRISRDVYNTSSGFHEADIPLDFAFGQTNPVFAVWFSDTLIEYLRPYEPNSHFSTNQVHYIFEYGVLTKTWRIQETVEKTRSDDE
jgi:hypothetical protein